MNKQSELENFHADLLENQKEARRDRILIAIVIFMSISYVFFRVFPLLYEDWYQTKTFVFINWVLSLVWAFLPLLLGLQVSDKKIRQTATIFGSIYVIVSIFFSFKDAVEQLF